MRTLYFVVILGMGAPALAQQAAPAPQPTEPPEKVVVPGVRPANLRAEIERLEDAVYDRFNSLNSSDEFDILCLKSEPTGSNITQRTCAPNFVIQAEARAATNNMREARNSGQGSRSVNADQQLLEQKSRELTGEMQRVARQDEQLMRDLVRLDELRTLQGPE